MPPRSFPPARGAGGYFLFLPGPGLPFPGRNFPAGTSLGRVAGGTE
jgi:hypothetical protein